MGKRAATLLSVAALLLQSPALAATPIDVPEGKGWTHSGTGFTIPVAIDGFTRSAVTDFGTTQSDVSAQYGEQSSGTFLTLYLFRAGAPDVSVWTDRAESSIFQNSGYYGVIDEQGRLWSRLSPWPNAADSALRIVLPLSGRAAKATGLVVARHGDWLIKLRMTSTTMSAVQLEARLASVLAALKLPQSKKAALPAYAIQPCPDALPATEAKLLKTDDKAAIYNAALLNSTLPGAIVSKPVKGAAAPPVYCRDRASQPNYGVYRPDGTRESYVIAAGDGGVSIMVGQDLAGALSKPPQVQFSATMLTNDRAIGLFPYQNLPSPKQVMDSLEKPRPLYLRSRIPGREKEIQILAPR